MIDAALVICGGGAVRAALPLGLGDALVIAADGGVAEAHRLGLHVDVLVGDLDSATPDEVASVEAAGGSVQRHPPDKDATDLELAVDHAVGAGARRVVVAGGAGGRFDMVLANALLLASSRYRDVELDAVFGGARLTVVRTRRDLAGPPGTTVSLLAIGGPARGVRTEGLRWPLDGETLEAGMTRGISNEFLGGAASVSIAGGVLIAVQP